MINIDKFEEKLHSYYCGNYSDTRRWLKKLSRQDRATVVSWCHVTDEKTAHKWSLWIIEGL